ncbi:hypothetical protein TVAG_432000 [Trichomonas vaginalis G3]|uniref:Uncharacterized protein n=1 Tax=Trichomonas vaginalis (strain ATCC PRA-98 / G3) TaxID=412133 RepID=A2F7Z7_TRIV3|nr:protein ubiquitination [Trichomonas vaginalis G3]EAX98991.1 hypothetical protein TVAG_432000 [Trichomonas vaginalis G3]KAI5507249.1 protein ubiquitination [Trichomonas vaginalis G3]|eukprot:XP_001311921.1 hypothetical protein [Trichomonas vaginalis G3]
MAAPDYESYAKEIEKWYNSDEFYENRTVSELCNIFDLCSFSSSQFIEAFTIISKKFKYSEVSIISQHVKVTQFESFEDAFEALDFISKILNTKVISDAAISLKNQKPKTGKNIKYLLKCKLDEINFEEIFMIIVKACEEDDIDSIKFAYNNGYLHTTVDIRSILERAIEFNNFKVFKYISLCQNFWATNSPESIRCVSNQVNLAYQDRSSKRSFRGSSFQIINKKDNYTCTRSVSINNIYDPFNDKRLLYAALNPNVEVIKLLGNSKTTDFGKIDEFCASALHYAALNTNVEVIKYLVSLQKFDINALDNNNKTPLHYAAHIKNIEVFKYLYSLPNINTRLWDKKGKTAIQYAAENEMLDQLNIKI